MIRTTIALATTLALLVGLPAVAMAKKKPGPRTAPVVAPLVLPPADSDQLAAAGLIFFGDYACEFGKSLHVSLNPDFDGYVDMLLDRQLFTLKPVLSHTGALRLEDVRGRLLVVQIAVKSMVMDDEIRQRLVDDCVHETQSENRRQLATAPARPGLGIDPVKAAADAVTQAAGTAAAATAVAPLQAEVMTPAPPASAAAAAPPPASSASGVDAGAR